MPSRSDGVRTLWRVGRPETGWMKTFRSQESCHRYIHGPMRRDILSSGLVLIFKSSVLDDEGQRIWVLHMNIDLG